MTLAFILISFSFTVSASESQRGFINATELNVRCAPTTSSQSVGLLTYTYVNILGSEYDGDGNLWYKIEYNGGSYYVFGSYVQIVDNSTQSENTSSKSFEEQLASFPESYHSGIMAIHEAYPNYIFEADYINTTFDDAVYQQTIGHRKLVNMYSDGVSWRALNSECYNRSSGTWNTYSGNWTDAAVNVIEYYMDPRNFLRTSTMYIFAKQTYTGSESRASVETMVSGTFLAGNYSDSTGTHSYVDTIMEASRLSNVSPYVIAATILTEQGTWPDNDLMNGSRGAYNFFNFGASGTTNSDVINNGITYAYNHGWTTVSASITGGAQMLYDGYLSDNQDTYFYKDFNLLNGNYYHQYAQGVYDQIGNASFLSKALSADHSGTVTLRIPVYKTMPVTPNGYQEETSSLNTRYNSDGSIIPRSSATIEMRAAGLAETIDEPEEEKEAENTNPVITEPDPIVEEPEFVAGDANGDGKVSPADYVIVKNHILGNKTITDAKLLKAADINNDGKISPADYVKIKNIILGR